MPGEFGHKFQKNAHVGWTGTNGYHYTNDFDPKLLKEKGEVRRSRLALAKRVPYFDEMSKLRTSSSRLIRTMMPFTFRCSKCDQFHYIGTKFDAIIYEIEDEKYLNKISIYRLMYRCCYCRNIVAFKTDPKNARYVMEYGGKVTASTQVGEAVDVNSQKTPEDDGRDALEKLEERANSLNLAMEEQEALEDLRADRLKRADTVSAVATVLDDMWGKKESKSRKRQRQENEIDLSDEVVADLFGDQADSLAAVPLYPATTPKSLPKKGRFAVKPKTSANLCLDYPSESD